MLEDIDLNAGLRKGLATLNLDTPTAVQAEAIPAALEGQDLLISAETGSGKTLAYLIPSAQRILAGDVPRTAGTLVLVLVPTRELARQVEKHFKALAKNTPLLSGVIIGGSSTRFQQSVLRKNPEFIIATPGRLVELLATRSADLASLQTLVLDEADRMLDMGFRDDVLKIIAACNPQRQTLLLSATLRHTGVTRIAGEILTDARRITLGSERSQHSQIHQQVILTDDRAHKEKVLAWLLTAQTTAVAAAPQRTEGDATEDDTGTQQTNTGITANQPAQNKALVFSNTRIQADQLGNFLRYHKLRAGVLHGELTQEERNQVVTQFAQGKVNVLVASDVAARGLDIKDIDTVINFDMPRNVDDYIHRIGRTGRAGRQGLAISFVSANDWNLMVTIERYTGAAFERRVIKSLKAKFKGPKKVKSSGKVAGPKKKKTRLQDKSATRHRNVKNKGKNKGTARPAAPEVSRVAGATPPSSNDGRAPLTRRTAPPKRRPD